MDNFNKVISFVLGLVVVLVFVAVISGKINLRGKSTTPSTTAKTGTLFGFNLNKKTTPTPTSKPVSSITINDKTTTKANNYGSYSASGKTTTPTTIPSTGLPTIFVPLMLVGSLGGSFLSKVGKK